MENILSRIESHIIAAKKIYNIRPSVILIILLLPFIIVFFFCVLLLLPSTHRIAVSIVENQPLKLLTFAFLIAGGILGLRLVFQIRQKKKGPLLFWFYFTFSIALIFIGMEKVRYGKQFFQSEIVSDLNNTNQQGEGVFHGVQFWSNNLEIFPLAFGLAGLLGVWISNRRHLRGISLPYVLWPCFAVIAVISAIDLSHDFYNPPPKFDDLINNLEEVIEMLVGISAFLIIWLNTRKSRFEEQVA